ncbi:hypothetical protein [Actinomadura keratinilytica]|uniref:hypothetical protein n=1 Tax=Actinomadura keratinilytica TaxID=547461 RepID=UPI00361B0EC5
MAVTGAVVAAGLTGCGVRDAADVEGEIGTAENETAVLKAMQEVVKAGFPGVMVSVKGKDGKIRDYSAGIGDRETGDAPPRTATCASAATPRRSSPQPSCSWSVRAR